MTPTKFLKYCLDSLEDLPVELQRNSTQMQNLDPKVKKQILNIEKLTYKYMLNVVGCPADKLAKMMICIQHQFDKAREYGDENVQLAIQSYEAMENHFKKLESELVKIQNKASCAIRNVEKNGELEKIKDKEITKTSVRSEGETSKKIQLKKGVTKTTSVAPSKMPLVNVATNPTNHTSSVTGVTIETSSFTGTGVANSAEVGILTMQMNQHIVYAKSSFVQRNDWL